jgi:hypothetical protein
MSRLRRSIVLAVGATLAAASLPVAPGATASSITQAAGEPRLREARLIRSLSMGEYGVTGPTGVTYSATDDRLLVTGAGGQRRAVVLAVSPSGKDPRRISVAVSAAGPTAAFDPITRRLTAVAGGRRIEADLTAQPDVHTVDLARLRLADPSGATYDPAGAWYVLDGDQVVRVAAGARPAGAAVMRRTLPGLDGSRLRGLAYNPRDGWLYTTDPRETCSTRWTRQDTSS